MEAPAIAVALRNAVTRPKLFEARMSSDASTVKNAGTTTSAHAPYRLVHAYYLRDARRARASAPIRS